MMKVSTRKRKLQKQLTKRSNFRSKTHKKNIKLSGGLPRKKKNNKTSKFRED